MKSTVSGLFAIVSIDFVSRAALKSLVQNPRLHDHVCCFNSDRRHSQDPYALSYFGISAVTIPLASREDTLALGRRYGIDYLLMPAARPALDALYLGVEADARFELAAHLAEAGEEPYELYRLVYES